VTKYIIQKEIETRRLKSYAQKIAKHNYDKKYNDLEIEELKEILSILDRYGSKYLQFYKFNNEEDKKTFISNLSNYSYQPIFDFEEQEKLEKVFVRKSSDNNNFEIMFNFEIIEEEWKFNEDKTIKFKHSIPRRRVLYLHNIENYVILAIDPIGIGRAIAGIEHLERYHSQIESILSNPLFDRINKLNIEEAIKHLIENLTLTAKGVKYEDRQTARETTTISKNSKDNLKDIIVKLPSKISIQDLKLKYQNKISLELFNKDLLKINSRANKDIHDEIKTSIISILQKK
jgi:EAL domain-containing protein (putative c-di-GMP-specific phosphodiesterase class I)